MNKDTAIAKGYVTTGHYARRQEEIEKLHTKVAEIRKAGYKALFITIPTNPLSRGDKPPGYGIAVEPRYVKDQTAEEYRKDLAGYHARVASIRARHEAAMRLELAQEESRKNDKANWLGAHGYTEI